MSEDRDSLLLAPVLEASLDELTDQDRLAILLRFTERSAFGEIGASLGLTEDAARKRVDRAMEKLRASLGRRGIQSSAAALGGAMLAHSVVAAPAGLAASVSGAVLSSAAASTGGLAFITFMSMTKVQIGIAALLCLGFAGWSISERRENSRLREALGVSQSAQAASSVAARREGAAPMVNETAQPSHARSSEKLSWAEIEARLSEIVRDQLWEDGGRLAFADQIDTEHLPAALSFVDRIATGNARRQLRLRFLELLARRDPAAAAAWCAQLPPSADRQNMIRMVGTFWAEKDPEAALQATGPSPDVFRQLASRTPESAATRALQLPAGEERRWIVSVVADTWFERDPVAAAKWADTLQEADDRISALQGMMRGLMESDARTVATYMGRLSVSDRSIELTRDFAAQWANLEVTAAAKWSLGLPENSPMQERVAAVVAEIWSRDEPTAAAAWISALPAGNTRNQAARAFIDQVAHFAPAEAAALASSLQDAPGRQQAEFRAAQLWLKVDPASATPWLERTTLTTAQKEKLLQNRTAER